MINDETYIFVDGNYLQETYDAQMVDFFGEKGVLDMSEVRKQIGGYKLFYYDSVDEVKRTNETEEERKGRVQKKESELTAFSKLAGVHVRRGSIRNGKKRREQKEVDVLLAVDTLNFAFYANMKTAVIVAGDIDFKPLIDSLVLHGTYVILYADKSSASEKLLLAADALEELSINRLFNWTEQEFRRQHRLPYMSSCKELPKEWQDTGKRGKIGERIVMLYQEQKNDGWIIIQEPEHESAEYHATRHSDRTQLEKYVGQKFGKVVWGE